MRTILVATGCALAVLPASIAAQGGPAAAPASGCFIQVPTLMAAPPAGIADLGVALRALDEKLRPQVEEINRLKAEIARLEQPTAAAASSTVDTGFEDDDAPAALAPLPGGEDPATEELAKLRADLEAKQAQLKLDYAAQQTAIVGPVQTKVSQRAQAFATQRQCAALKMARPPDLAALQTAGAQDVTVEFVSWYAAN